MTFARRVIHNPRPNDPGHGRIIPLCPREAAILEELARRRAEKPRQETQP